MQAAKKVAHKHTYKRQRSLRLVRPRARKKSRRSFSFGNFLSLVIILAFVVMFNLSQRALIAQETLRLEQLKGIFDKEEVIREKLLLQTKNLRSPQRVETIATRKLAMIEPIQVRYIYLPENITSGGDETSRRPLDKSNSSYSKSPAKSNLIAWVVDKFGQQIKALTSGGLAKQTSSN